MPIIRRAKMQKPAGILQAGDVQKTKFRQKIRVNSGNIS